VARAASTVADDVAARARGLNDYMARLEKLHRQGQLSKTDLSRAQAGAFLAFHTYLERSLERLFLGVLMRRLTTTDTRVRPLVDIKSEAVARSVVNGGRNYVDWLPFEQHALKRAGAFLSTGRPFADLARSDYSRFDRLSILRNAIAHESSHAMRQFRKSFTDGKSLPPDQVVPGGYLRGQHRPGQTRFENLMAEVVVSFRKLCG
jgi:hypothetical protein